MVYRNPAKDQLAIVGVGTTTPFARDLGGRSAGALAIEACKNAILDAGLTAKDIEQILTSTEKVTRRGRKIEELEFGDGPAEPEAQRVLPAANESASVGTKSGQLKLRVVDDA